jgi:hypothetical protein
MHDVLCAHHDDCGDEYHCAISHMVVKCRGCGSTSFRYVFADYEDAYPISDGEWEVPKTIKTYPKFIENHTELDGIHCVPEIVGEIYEESLIAIQEGAGILAGLGLRGTIEAICNERSIAGKNLEVRISKLASQGLISQKDAERLHAIRFLGNDAAHDIKKPTDRQIAIALRIIEHLIVTVYILDNQVKGKLDTIVTEYEDFTKLLKSHLKEYSSGDEFPLAKFLAKDVRRIQGALSHMESQLIAEIQAGSFTALSVGKVDTFGASPGKLQHFKLPK